MVPPPMVEPWEGEIPIPGLNFKKYTSLIDVAFP